MADFDDDEGPDAFLEWILEGNVDRKSAQGWLRLLLKERREMALNAYRQEIDEVLSDALDHAVPRPTIVEEYYRRALSETSEQSRARILADPDAAMAEMKQVQAAQREYFRAQAEAWADDDTVIRLGDVRKALDRAWDWLHVEDRLTK
jgi:hypothetical protein